MEVDFMEPLEQLVSKYFILLILIYSCNPINGLVRVNYDDIDLNLRKRYVEYKERVFTGLVYRLYPNSTDTLSKSFYENGLKEGIWLKFYRKSKLQEKREFKKGKKEGLFLGFYSDGSKGFEYNFKNGEYHGKSREWKNDGMLLRESNYVNGYEEGPQKIWYIDGRIKSNYIIKNNRRYGLLGTKNCVNVSDSIFVM